MKVVLALILTINLVAAFAFAISPSDPPAVHGMLMVGTRTIFLSHLPMFHSPHDYQVILEVSLKSLHASPQNVYVNDRVNTHERIYTLVPDKSFVLPEMVEPKKSFPATIYRGHFERGGVPIFKGAIVTVEKVVYFHKFNPADGPLHQLQYLLFGKGDELFMAHQIATCPDYDQIVAVQIAHPISPALFASAISTGKWANIAKPCGRSARGIAKRGQWD